MTHDQRKALLELVSLGLDIEAGAAQLGLPMHAVHKSGKAFAKQLDAAFAVGSARLRARVLETALEDGDGKAISAVLDARELSAARDTSVRRIEPVIIDSPCQKCGHVYRPKVPVRGTPGKRTNGAGSTEVGAVGVVVL